jgi:hypothetical protein
MQLLVLFGILALLILGPRRLGALWNALVGPVAQP